MVARHHRFNGHEFEQTPGDGEGQGSLACCSPWGHKELDMTSWLNSMTCHHLLFSYIPLHFSVLHKPECTYRDYILCLSCWPPLPTLRFPVNEILEGKIPIESEGSTVHQNPWIGRGFFRQHTRPSLIDQFTSETVIYILPCHWGPLFTDGLV